MKSKSQAAIDRLEDRIAYLTAENTALKRELKGLRDTIQCSSCRNSYPNVLAYWPGMLIEGETRCVHCYAREVGHGAPS